MITQETAVTHAKELMEYIQAGNQIVEVCACEEKNEVVRRQWRIEAQSEQILTVEQIEDALVQKDTERGYLLTLKAKIEEEKEKLLEVNEETDTI